MDIQKVCQKCKGTGQMPSGSGTAECNECEGTGRRDEGEISNASETLDERLNHIEDRLNTPILIFPALFDSVTQGSFIDAGDNDYYFGAKFYNSSNTDGDQVNYKVYMGSGTYTFKFIHGENVTFGILKLLIDDVEKASFDCYNAGGAQVNVIDTETGIEIAESGIKTVSLKIDGKNASSTGYYMNVSALYLYKTS